VGTAAPDTALGELQERRAFLCRLTPDRALETFDDAEEFLRDRGMLTRTTDSSLPSLFEACHEDPYAPDRPGFGQWPKTKWSWSFMLPARPGVYTVKIHRGKTLYFTHDIARILDPICRAEIGRMENVAEWALLLRHLGDAGPSTVDDIKTEVGLKPKEVRKILSPLERCGAVVSRPVEPTEEGMVDAFEYLRWDQLFPDPLDGDARFEDLIVAGVHAAVVAPERELPRWFAHRWRFEPDLVDRLVSEGRLERPEPGWIAIPASS
jgi:hypothetical protein